MVGKHTYIVFSFFDKDLSKDFDVIKSSLLEKKLTININLLKSVLLIEDVRFFEHKGIDLRAILRAIYNGLFLNRLEGGSTIEQQYVRLITKKREISLKRKIRESLLAIKLSDLFSKDKILESYLTNYEFYGGIKGVIQLIDNKGFDATNLSNNHISILVSRIKYPFVSDTNSLYLRRISIIKSIINRNDLSPQIVVLFAR